jgi:hypothetical protein
MRKPAAAEAQPRREEMKPRAAETQPRRDQMKKEAAEPDKKREHMKKEAAEPSKTKDTQRAEDTDRKGATTAEHKDREGAPRIQGKANISTEHATRISQVLRQESQPERVNVDIRVGERIPETVVVRPLPMDVVELVPEYRGYDYFVDSDDEIVFVSPDTHEIVGTIDYGSGDAPVMAGARPCPVEN